MDLLLRDTLSGRAQPVRRRPGRPVSLYVCGPTVYDGAHVGHARTYLFFDLVRRHLEAEGIPVRHVMNVTNFEDKIDARAAELGLGWRSLALREEAGFLRDLRDLRILTPHVQPRASAFVPQMTDVARRLARNGRVHRQGDEWLYSPPNRPAGANFLTGKELGSHAVEEPDHPFPLDDASAGEFMVWKLQDRPRPSWPGPWGRGTPGWHLECYAMAHELLGLPVDVHGGGTDLIFPHHYAENEVALALNHRPFARLFVHPGLVLWEGSKMSKSKGNLVPLRTSDARGRDRMPCVGIFWDGPSPTGSIGPASVCIVRPLNGDGSTEPFGPGCSRERAAGSVPSGPGRSRLRFGVTWPRTSLRTGSSTTCELG